MVRRFFYFLYYVDMNRLLTSLMEEARITQPRYQGFSLIIQPRYQGFSLGGACLANHPASSLNLEMKAVRKDFER